jgi:hypothetical protein
VRSRRFAACGLAFALCASACGGHGGISRSASAQLANAVAGVRAAARAHDVTAARARLDDVRRIVVSLKARGDLGDAAARRILVAADEVGGDLSLISTTTTSTTTTTTQPAPSPTVPPVEKPKGHHGHGHGDNGD